MIGDDARFDELMNRLKATGIGKSVSAFEWEEVENFIEENILTEEKIMKQYESGKHIGERDAKERITHFLFQKASAHFVAGRDREAEQMRSIANEVAKSEGLKP